MNPASFIRRLVLAVLTALPIGSPTANRTAEARPARVSSRGIQGTALDFWKADSSPPPTLANVPYGESKRQVLDFWKADSRQPTPLVFFIHGGSWKRLDKGTGERRPAKAYRSAGGRTQVPLAFDPCGSWCVVFREPAAAHPAVAESNLPETIWRRDIAGAWTVSFDPKWGGEGCVEFPEQVSWPSRPEPGIKYYSGTAVYRKAFDLPSQFAVPGSRTTLELSNVRELAEVRLNGKSCGITWTPPFRVNVTDAIRTGTNQLEIEVVNFWPNRIIGDQALPEKDRFTRTNIRTLRKDTPPMESGLLGPVGLQAEIK
jgi:hypothetical protein